MLKKFTEGRVVCVDAAHGTNANDFKLVALPVVDEGGEGFPVAWCTTNKEDRVVLIGFCALYARGVGWCALCGYV